MPTVHQTAARACVRVLVASIALFAAQASAQTAPPNELDQLRQREERERLEQEILQRLAEQQQRARDSEAPIEEDTPRIPDLAGHAFRIDRIVLDGERRPPKSRRAILAQHEGRTLDADAMLGLVRALMNDYAHAGYATTTVVLKPQNLRSGTLVLAVQWGRVKGWRFSGEAPGGLRERALHAMLPRVEGDVLNIRAADQAIEALNNGRLSATVDVVPADEPGWSWLDVRAQPMSAVGANAGVDNSGTSEHAHDGRFRTTAGLQVAGPGADLWSISASRRHFYDGIVDLEDSFTASMAMPLGFWDLQLRHGTSRYEKVIGSIFGTYASNGRSQDQALEVGRTVARSKRGKTDVTLDIQRKASENFIAGTRLDVNSKVYSDVTLGIARVDQLWGGSLYASVDWGRGTRWLGADDVTINAAGHTPALYYKYAGNISWNRAFALGARSLDLGVRGGWQYTPRQLLSANKLTLGDEYTVRGFKGNSVYGDKGGYLSTTLAMPIGGGVSMFVGADAGAVDDNGPDSARQVLSGWAVGMRAQWRHASLSVTHAAPIRTEDRDAPDVLYASAGVRF